MNRLQPIGSIVKLNNDKNLYMIMGYYKNDKRKPEIVYDYCACRFPMGFSIEQVNLFNEDDIDAVFFVGYQTKESIDFREDIKSKVGISKENKND